MRPPDLETYLHEHIPLSRAMQVSVRSIEREHVVLAAPLEPNINHRETVFGGSAAALAILAAWALLHTRLADDGIEGRLVIQRNSMDYERPITGPFTARSSLAPSAEWAHFIRVFARRGRARIAARSSLHCADERVAQFEGDFVALGVGRWNV
jgi:thioesterase domain-containing protein